MIEDREKGIVYVPVAKDFLPELYEWSEPVRVRIEPVGGELSLVFKRVDTPEPAQAGDTKDRS